MSTPTYKKGERVRFLAEGTVAYVRHAPCEAPHPGALTIAVPLEGCGTYDVTVPLVDAVTIERLAPTVLPREIWGDRDGDPWFAVCVLGFDTPRTMMLPAEFHDLKSAERSAMSPEGVNRRYGPITRVYPLPAPAAVSQPEADRPPAPRLMVGDVWSGDEWTVIEQDGRLLLTWDGETRTWESADGQYGTLALIERAGYRRTTDTATAGQLRSGQVVSCEEWEDGAPVTITGWHVIADDARRLEVEYRPLGWISKITRTAAPDARITLWASVGGAR